MSDTAQRTLRTIIGGTPGILALKTKTLKYEVVNPTLCQLLAKAPQEIVGKGDEELFPAEEAAALAKESKSVLSSTITKSAQLPLTCKDGQHWFDITLSAVLDDNGDPAGILIAGHDITPYKQREAALQQGEAKIIEAESARAAAQAQYEDAMEKMREMLSRAKPLEEAAAQLPEIQDHLKQREKQLAQTLKQVQTLEAEIEPLRVQHQELQTQLATAQAQAADLQAQHANLESQHQAQVADLQTQLANLESQHQTQRQALETQNNQLQSQITAAQALARQLQDALNIQ